MSIILHILAILIKKIEKIVVFMPRIKQKTKTKVHRERGNPRDLSYMTASGPPRDERGRIVHRGQVVADSETLFSILIRRFRSIR